jgi:hypothetical protein
MAQNGLAQPAFLKPKGVGRPGGIQPVNKILLFQWFDCRDPTRRVEFETCIEHNLTIGFDEFIIFNESTAPRYFDSTGGGRVTNIETNKRLTFRDYLQVVNTPTNRDTLIVLTNTDIRLDKAILDLGSIMRTNDFLCFSRYEADGRLKDAPWCTQDVWAMLSQPVSNGIIFQSDIPIGMPGCELRFSEIMFGAGYSIFNPALDVRHSHLHSHQVAHDENNRVYGAYLFTPPCTIAAFSAKEPGCMGQPVYLTKFSQQPSQIEPPAVQDRGSEQPKRNDPCPCGSGRKFKHCHGAYRK